MNKNVLYSAVRKVFLDLKDVEHFVFWDTKDSILKLKSLDIAYNTTVMATSNVAYHSRVEHSVILKEPDLFLKTLDISTDDVEIEIKSSGMGNSIFIRDSSFESEIIVADINYISADVVEKKNSEPEEPISYDVQIDINQEFIDKFVKAKRANKSEVVSIWTKERKTVFQLGDDNNFSNKIKFAVEMEGMFEMNKLLFSSTIIQTIFDRNKKATGKLFVDPSGLMKLYFEETIDDQKISSTYFIVAQDSL